MTSPAPIDGRSTLPGPSTQRNWRFLRRPGWIGAILGALVFAALCWTVLAPWQFGRHSERTTANAQIHAAIDATPRPVTELLSVDHPPLAASTWQPATATGTFIPELQVLVRLRQDANGQPASEVVTPFRLTDGTTLLVDRGYVPIDLAGAPAAPPSGQVTVTGRVQPDQPDPLDRGPVVNAGRTEVVGISAAGIPGLSGPSLQGFIQLLDGVPGVLRPIGFPQTDDGPFLSYALQWCAFGVMGLLAVGFFVVREYREPRPEDERPAGGKAREGRSRDRGFDRSELYDPPHPD